MFKNCCEREHFPNKGLGKTITGLVKRRKRESKESLSLSIKSPPISVSQNVVQGLFATKSTKNLFLKHQLFSLCPSQSPKMGRWKLFFMFPDDSHKYYSLRTNIYLTQINAND